MEKHLQNVPQTIFITVIVVGKNGAVGVIRSPPHPKTIFIYRRNEDVI